MGIIFLTVLTSGCIRFSTTETKTFSNGNMSFSYPDNFMDITEPENNNSSSSWQGIVKLGNNNLMNMQLIQVDKNTV